MESQFPGMDYDFLRYMGVTPENQRRIQSHYMPYFEQCNRVVDLACGDADFVELLVERGIEVVGVDSDDKTYAATAAKGLPIIKQDVFDWLAEQPDASFDGVFSAHLIEHLPYPKVVELIEQSYRILQPGGIVVLATPNARSLFSHLEMFYTHFGHITFYHPRLVTFFLDRAGFVDGQFGENPQTASPLLAKARALLEERPVFIAHLESPDLELPTIGLPGDDSSAATGQADERARLNYKNVIPSQGKSFAHSLLWRFKRSLTNWMVRPLLDDLAVEVEKVLAAEREHARETKDTLAVLASDVHSLRTVLNDLRHLRRRQLSALGDEARLLRSEMNTAIQSVQDMNGAFETFIWARKPRPESALVME